MFSQNLPGLENLLLNQGIDDLDLRVQQPDDSREALIRALLPVPLEIDSVTRIRLGDYFRRSLQSKRSVAPYRLHTIISECKAGTIDGASLEAIFFQRGGTKAVTGLAAAATDNKQVIPLLTSLRDVQLQRFITSIELITPHQDLLFIAETLDRKKPARISKRKAFPSARTRRRSKGNQAERRGTTVTPIGNYRCSVPGKAPDGNVGEYEKADQCITTYFEGGLSRSITAHPAPRGNLSTESEFQSQSDIRRMSASGTTASTSVSGFRDSDISNQILLPATQHWQATHFQSSIEHDDLSQSINMPGSTEDAYDALVQPHRSAGPPEEQRMCHKLANHHNTNVF